MINIERIGHDQLFKQLLQAFFADFMRLFDPETAAQLDLSTISFRDAEAFTDIPQGERRTADLVAEIRTLAGLKELILAHVEIQREREARFPRRMWQYYSVLRQREDLPVIPIAVVLYPGRVGIAREVYEETVLGQTILTFSYLQISLPLLDSTEYVGAESVLGAGLASVMRLPARREAQIALHLASLRRVREALDTGQVDDARAFLLVNFIATYLPLNDAEREELRVQLEQEGDSTMETTELTWAERMFEQGEQRGMRAAIRQLLRARFGSVSPEAEATLAGLTREEDLTAFIGRAAVARSEAELLTPAP